MRAVILDTSPHAAAKGQHTPPCLVRLGDRPFLQHVVECLVRRGVREFDFAMAESPRLAAEYLGDGSRWGCRFRFHLISKAGVEPLVRSLTNGCAEPIVVGRAERLPGFIPADAWTTPEPALFFVCKTPDGEIPAEWTGWALFGNGADLNRNMDEARYHFLLPDGALLPDGGDLPLAFVQHQLSVDSPAAILSSQRKLLSGLFPELIIGGRQVSDGVWLGRNVTVHPSAKLVSPVYIGSNTQVGAGALVGPYTVLAEDCIIGSDSLVNDSLVCPNTYVGEHLHINQSIVDRNLVTDVRGDAVYRMTDNFLLGSLSDEKHAKVKSQALVDRVLAAILLVGCSPFFLLRLLLQLHRSGLVEREEVMQIPEQSDEHAWKSFFVSRWRTGTGARRKYAEHFWSVFLPGLSSVVKGHLSLVGVEPRSARGVAELPEDWRTLYLQTKAGLVTDAVVNFEEEPNEAEVHASECYYSATQSFSRDLRLLGSYLLKVSASPFSAQPERAQDQEVTIPLPRRPASPETKIV